MSNETLLAPIHPGEILLEEFLEPMNITQYRLAKDIGVPPRRINEIVQGKGQVKRPFRTRSKSSRCGLRCASCADSNVVNRIRRLNHNYPQAWPFL